MIPFDFKAFNLKKRWLVEKESKFSSCWIAANFDVQDLIYVIYFD